MVGRLPFPERAGDPLDRRAAVHRQQARPAARLASSTAGAIDLKTIRSPIIVFASWGDNITPPQQALNWIVDTYADEQEIKIRGQRIIYMVHDKVGHLGIFVSSSIAKKEHAEVTSTMKTIEALAPGLYEMTIDEQIGEGVDARFIVSFHERKLTDILAIDDNDRVGRARLRRRRAIFGARHGVLRDRRASAGAGDGHAAGRRPPAQRPSGPRLARDVRRRQSVDEGRSRAGAKARAERKPADPAIRSCSPRSCGRPASSNTFDVFRDWRDALYEATFLGIYGSPAMICVSASPSPSSGPARTRRSCASCLKCRPSCSASTAAASRRRSSAC